MMKIPMIVTKRLRLRPFTPTDAVTMHQILSGIVHPENLASQRVLSKIGLHFVEEAEYFGMACYKYVGERPFAYHQPRPEK